MNTVKVPSWAIFRERLSSFSKLPRNKRNGWSFRGQSQASHSLQPTIDRTRTFPSDLAREGNIRDLLLEFRREVVSLGYGDNIPLNDQFELLARHHGLPSPYLDWTRTPWVACYFAFSNAEQSKCPNVAVYALSRPAIDSLVLSPLPASAQAQVELVNDPELVSANPRAIRQRGVFIRLSTCQRNLESLLSSALTKFEIPALDKEEALGDLDQMLLNGTMLMYDLDAAARTATWRLA